MVSALDREHKETTTQHWILVTAGRVEVQAKGVQLGHLRIDGLVPPRASSLALSALLSFQSLLPGAALSVLAIEQLHCMR